MTVKCPVCRTELVWESNPYRPFCSERCQRIDLGRWASGQYAIPSRPSPENAESDPGADSLPDNDA